MLKQDAIWEMPPFVGWYQGAENIGRLIDTQCPGGVHDMRMVPTPANGQPAFGLYMRQPGRRLPPFHLQVLTIEDGRVAHVGAFFERRLFDVRPAGAAAGRLRRVAAPPGLMDVPSAGAGAGGSGVAVLDAVLLEAPALLERAISYTRAALALLPRTDPDAPTPCPDWT